MKPDKGARRPPGRGQRTTEEALSNARDAIEESIRDLQRISTELHKHQHGESATKDESRDD